MILQFLFAVSTVGAAVAQSACPSCNACVDDGCFQQLAGISNFPVQATVDDCRSFLWITVTVADTTVTITTVLTTITASTTQTSSSTSPTNVPAYANSCTAASAYSSACGCIGVKASSTSYIHIPEVTVIQRVLGTEYALQLTSDLANGIYNGSYLYPSSDGYSNLLLFTSDPSQAGKFYANSSGNFTDANGAPFAYEPDSTGNFFSLLPSDGYSSQSTANCWIDSNSTFQCAGLGGRYIGIDSATMQLKSFDAVKDIYLSNATGPILLKAVTHPASGGNGTPAAVARTFIFRNDPTSTYLIDQFDEVDRNSDTGATVRIKSFAYVSDMNLAARYLVDPLNGNVRSLNNEPFVYESSTAAAKHIWSGFPDPAQSIIVTCTMGLSDLIFSCRDEGYGRLALQRTSLPNYQQQILFYADSVTLPSNSLIGPPLYMVGLPQ
ncbi:hypothetical protein H072_465 [Dactylellina haptotyla CBS 200.50]|uniref:Phytase-like domain-containing protein n=1 Tax=Dactylellina haptotyla (strain CBS 200.50) TaxID=1284197 RepID=S8CD05_DACHA|nr:hypothetical protein H072_465 [Dactylellina haptotyla CBS 200.50]